MKGRLSVDRIEFQLYYRSGLRKGVPFGLTHFLRQINEPLL